MTYRVGRVTTLAGSALFVVGIILFHWRGLVPGYTFLAVDIANEMLPWRSGDGAPVANWLISDPVYQYYPFATQTAAAWTHGERLLWNPGIFLGHPALADPIFQTFYPPPVIFSVLFGPARGLGLNAFAHVLVAGACMIGLLRSLQIGLGAAVLGGFVYALSGFMVTWLETPFWVGTMTWLPAVLWAYVAALHRRRWSYVAASGLALGLAALAGQFQFLLVLLGLLAFLSISFALRGPRRFDPWPLVVFLAMVTLGIAIGAVQIWPFAEFLPMTRRSLDDATVGRGSSPLPLAQLITLLVPDAFGNPARNDTYWGYANFSEATIYVGTATLLLALLGVAAKPRFWPLVLTAAVIGVLYVATGGPGVAALTSLPLARGLAVHRVIFLLPLLIGWLAAIGLDRKDVRIKTIIAGVALIAAFTVAGAFQVAKSERARDLLWEDLLVAAAAITLAGALLVAAQRRPDWRRVAVPAIIVVVFGNLFWFGSSFNPTGRVDELMPPTPTAEFLAAQPGMQRVIALQRNGELLFGPNTLANYGLDDPAGYSSLVTRRYHNLVVAADPEIDNNWVDRQMNFVLFSYPSERLLDMLNVGYLVAPEVIFDPGPEAEIAPGACAATTSAIAPGKPVSGTFSVWHTAINRIDLPFAFTPAAETDGEMLFQLWRDPERIAVIAEIRIPFSEVADTPLQTLYFSPEDEAPGRTYAWQLSTEDNAREPVALCAHSDGTPALAVYGAQLAEVFRDGDIGVYRRFAPHYRAAIVYGATTIADDGAAMARILDPDFDLRNQAVSSVDLGLPTISPLPANKAEVVSARNDRIVIRADAARAGVLVLADQYHPGWMATVDGRPAPVVRVNTILRGVRLSPGAHEVIFTFRPASLRLGLAVSVGGLLAALLLVAAEWVADCARLRRRARA